jgi:hypothetical protein
VRLDQPSQALEIRLVRAGVITGSVTDAKGAPVRGARVYALPRAAGGGPLRIGANERGAMLNERGQYRIHSLPPGEYAVAVTYGASSAAFGSSGGADVRPDLGSGSLLYPENARPRFFTVTGGEEYRNVDFSVVPQQLHSVSGTIDRQGGKGDFWLALIPGEREALAAAVTKTKTDGSFRFEGVPGGNYVLTAAGPILGYGGKGIPGDSPLYGRVPVSVASDVESLAVPLTKGAEVLFLLRGSGGCAATGQVSLVATEDFAVRIDRSGSVQAGKETPLANLAPAHYQVTATGLAEGCYQSAAAELDLTRGTPQEAVTVLVGQAGALHGKLAGAVKGARYLVTLTPADAVNGSEALHNVFADGAGAFAFAGIRPGPYRMSIRWNRAVRAIDIDIAGGSATEVELPAPVAQE